MTSRRAMLVEVFVGFREVVGVGGVVVVVHYEDGRFEGGEVVDHRLFGARGAGEAEVDVFGVETAGDYGFVCHAGS